MEMGIWVLALLLWSSCFLFARVGAFQELEQSHRTERISGDKMGLPRPPAFLDPSLDENVIYQNGVNYASGGGGILNETSSLFIQRFSLYKQIELFQGTQEFMRMNIGREAADKLFGEAFYVVAMGSNDFINNYLLPVYADSWNYNGDTFVTYLITTLEAQLRLLYSLGARKLTFFGLGPMGCIPLQRILTSSGGCQQSTNKLALNFNKQALKLISDLSSSLANTTFKFGDAYVGQGIREGLLYTRGILVRRKKKRSESAKTKRVVRFCKIRK